MTGRISFIGAGPGAADLITVRGARRIGEADVVIWAASLVTPECVREHARAEVELVDATRLTDEAAVEIYRRAERDGLRVARLHSGDPALWGAIREQYAACTRMNLSVEIVPGVAEFSAAAASVGGEMTSTEFAPSAVITRWRAAGPRCPPATACGSSSGTVRRWRCRLRRPVPVNSSRSCAQEATPTTFRSWSPTR